MKKGKLFVMNHPLIKHKITLLREKDTGTYLFRQLVREITMLMAYEVTSDEEIEEIEIETPMCKATGYQLKGKKIAIVPILRAGLGMMEGFLDIIPLAKIGHIGLYRDEVSFEPVEYFCKMPREIDQRDVLLVDPMLATGGSAAAAIDLLKQKGINKIKLVVLISAPEGIKYIQEKHPDVSIYTGTIDERLNEKAYIIPGLGDAGDRIFGTEIK